MNRDKNFYRSIVLHYFDVKYLSAQTHKVLKNCYGENAPCERITRYWISKFKSGNISFTRQSQGRPTLEISRQKLTDFLKETPKSKETSIF